MRLVPRAADSSEAIARCKPGSPMAAATERFASQLVCESEPLTHAERLEAAALIDALLSGSAPLLQEDAPVPRPLYWQDIVAPVPADRADSPSSRSTRAETVEVGGADSSPEMVPVGTEERALFRSQLATAEGGVSMKTACGSKRLATQKLAPTPPSELKMTKTDRKL